MLVVEMYCSEFVKHTMVQIRSKCLRKALTGGVFSDSNFLGYKVPTNVSGFESSEFMLYL